MVTRSHTTRNRMTMSRTKTNCTTTSHKTMSRMAKCPICTSRGTLLGVTQPGFAWLGVTQQWPAQLYNSPSYNSHDYEPHGLQLTTRLWVDTRLRVTTWLWVAVQLWVTTWIWVAAWRRVSAWQLSLLLPDASKCYFWLWICTWRKAEWCHILTMLDFPCKAMNHATSTSFLLTIPVV